MLSIGKLVAGAEDYYLSMVAQGREEYYTGSGESPGTWLGRGTNALALAGEVSADDLRAMLAGQSPRTGSELGLPKRSGPRVAGFDLTFSAPKSVSLLYALGSTEQSAATRAAHERAVAEGLDYLERHAVFARRGDGGARRIGTSGLVAAAFVHRTSRNGDPQLHTHVLAANAVEGADGRWSAPDARLLYFHARTAGFVYQASLRAGLVESLGVSFGPVHRGAAELGGIDSSVLRRFSSRRSEIEEYLAAYGSTSRRSSELAALATRVPKERGARHVAGAPDLRSEWRRLAHEQGVDPDGLFADVGPPRTVSLAPQAVAELAGALLGPDGLTAEDSTFEPRDVVQAVAERAAEGAHLDAIEAAVERVLSRPDAIALDRPGRGGEGLHTTRELLDLEARLIETAVGLSNRSNAAIGVPRTERILARHLELSADQRAAVRTLVTSTNGVDVVVGKAGAGKTTALSLAREIFEQVERQVSGTALSARAAQELEASAGIASVTLARLMGQLDGGTRTLGPRNVVVIDEAGMVGTRTLARLVDAARESGAKLVLVGDHRQLPEIAAGGAFGTLARRLGALELTENRRQHERWERLALDELRAGDVTAALGAYEDHRRIRVAATMAESRQDLVARWLHARDGGDRGLMVAVNRRDVGALNRAARQVLQGRGTLGPDVVEAHGRVFALGDEVLCLRNARRLGVINGTRGVVVDVVAGDLVIDTDDGAKSLPPAYLDAGHLDHGYASTVHKTQGATYDRAFVLATESLTREAGYVAMSRARRGTELFVIAGVFEQGLGPEVPEVEPLARTAARLSVSRAKVLASSHLEQGPIHQLDLPQGIGGPLARAADTVFAGVGSPDDTGLGTSHRSALLGPPPVNPFERARYDRLTEEINNYRQKHEVDGDDPLGPRPFEARVRLAYDALLADLRRYERQRTRALEVPGRERGLGR